MILVTGGAGYVGSHCVKELLRQNREVVIFDNLDQGVREAVLSERFVEGDLLRREDLECVFDQYEIDAVMHFAALASVGDSMRNPQRYYENNVVGTLNLLGAMHEHGVKRLIFSSSAAVYGDPDLVPIPEDHRKLPKNPYGRTKWMMEEAMADYAQGYDLRYIALRYFNAAGCDPEGNLGENHDPEEHLIPIVLDVVLGRRETVTIFGTDYDTPDGTCVRDYVHVSDLANAHVLALDALTAGGKSTAYNLGIGNGYSVREVIDSCRRATGRDIAVEEGSRRPGDPAVLVADPTRAIRELGWKPQFTDLDEIMTTAWRQRKSTAH